MKKILFVTESLNVGGMEKVQVAIANALVSSGYDVTIVTYMPTARDGLLPELDGRVHFRFKKRKEFPFFMKHSATRKYFKSDRYEKRQSPRKLWNYFVGNKEKYDVEVAFYRGPSVKIVGGSPNKRAKRFAWVHSDYSLITDKSLTKFFRDRDEQLYCYGRFDRIIPVSDAAGKSFAGMFGFEDKLTTVYNMISLADIDEKKKEPCPLEKRKFTVVSVGRMVPAKGYDCLLDAVKRLKDDGFDFDLWLVGYGAEEEKLRECAEKNGLDNVTFTGGQTNPYKYLAAADMFVCSSFREGFSIVCAEALACSLPVLSTSCTGPVEILRNGEYGILTDCGEEGIYTAFRRILENPAVLKPFAEKARARARDFDTQVITGRIISLFEGTEIK